eukprot:TRINITY_DN4115_c0_g1_i1.p1 TRINITY_DN4115_c0_g1~~TRINITY_DN4115_c0_g1_i1.p1  ORF type:complete len:101 (+),score=6.21 TRINITY_DN4115_c0_g1_i1:1-303(+)
MAYSRSLYKQESAVRKIACPEFTHTSFPMTFRFTFSSRLDRDLNEGAIVHVWVHGDGLKQKLLHPTVNFACHKEHALYLNIFRTKGTSSSLPGPKDTPDQ